MALKILEKHSEMSINKETFITDAIILAKVKHGEDETKMAETITEKLKSRYVWKNRGKKWVQSCLTCGWTKFQWNEIVTKIDSSLGFNVQPVQGTLLDANYDGFRFTIYANFF